MARLDEVLQKSSWRLLKVIGRQRGLRFSSNIRKADLVNRLSQLLPDPDNLCRALATLSVAERQALIDLLTAGGRLARRHWQPRPGDLAGQLASAKHNQDDVARPSSLERLLHLGLIFREPATDDLFIPADLIPLLPAPASPLPPRPRATAGPAPVELICHDLAYLLGLLQRDDIRPLHRRWLPPRFLASWGQGCLTPPVSPAARSELQTGRRRFLHYLAENAGLVSGPLSVVRRGKRPDTGQRTVLKPAPAGWLWLKAAYVERLQALWDAWSNPQPGLWQAYRLPGYDWLIEPATLLAPVHQGLSQIDPADPVLFAQSWLKRQPHLLDLVPANMLDPVELLIGTMTALLTGPLTWLGVLSEQGSTLTGGPSAALVLTPQGQAWLAGQPLATADVPLPCNRLR